MDNPFDISCRHASELLSQAEDRRLGLLERGKLRLHLTVCDGCRNFQQHLGFIRSAVRRLLDDDSPDQR